MISELIGLKISDFGQETRDLDVKDMRGLLENFEKMNTKVVLRVF